MSFNNERSYYSEEDIRIQFPGYLRLANVLSYDTSTKIGLCSLDYQETEFYNPISGSPSVGDKIVVSQVEHEKYKLMICKWSV